MHVPYLFRGCGSGNAWIRIKFRCWILLRIWNLSWEPDSGAKKTLKKAKKTLKEGDFLQFRKKLKKTTF